MVVRLFTFFFGPPDKWWSRVIAGVSLVAVLVGLIWGKWEFAGGMLALWVVEKSLDLALNIVTWIWASLRSVISGMSVK